MFRKGNAKLYLFQMLNGHHVCNSIRNNQKSQLSSIKFNIFNKELWTAGNPVSRRSQTRHGRTNGRTDRQCSNLRFASALNEPLRNNYCQCIELMFRIQGNLELSKAIISIRSLASQIVADLDHVV